MMPDMKFYLRVLSRRLPAMTALFFLATTIGVVVAMRLPPIYQTTAKLLVESSQITQVESSIDIDAAEQLEVIQQRLMTRSNLLDIARRYNVFQEAASMSPDEIVAQMQEQTRIQRSSGRNRATLMNITFEGGDPRTIANVVNQYVTIILETNAEIRAGQTNSETEFFEQQAEKNSASLDLQNQKIASFKAENADALPDNLEYRLSRQSLLLERMAGAERDIASLEAQRANIIQVANSTGSIGAITDRRLSPDEQRLQALESELNNALSVFSETNPKVVTLRRRVEGLANKLSTTAATTNEDGETTQTTVLDVSLAEIDTRLVTRRQEVDDVKEELKALEDSIARTPSNEIALNAMERELQNIQNLYAVAVRRLSEAQMGQQIELSSKGERISVIESANVPTEPYKPNRPIVAGMGAAVGLGLAAGLFLLLELLNQSIRHPSEIASSLNITPLATVPRIETIARRRWRRFVQLLVFVLMLLGVPAILWAIDTYYLPLDLLLERVKDRII